MPKGRMDTPVYSRNIGFDMRVAFDGSNRVQYVGMAYPSAKDSDSTWQIYKLQYDATAGQVDTRRYADGTDDFTKCWNDRATYSYEGIT